MNRIGNNGEFMNLPGIPIGNWIFSHKFASYLQVSPAPGKRWERNVVVRLVKFGKEGEATKFLTLRQWVDRGRRNRWQRRSDRGQCFCCWRYCFWMEYGVIMRIPGTFTTNNPAAEATATDSTICDITEVSLEWSYRLKGLVDGSVYISFQHCLYFLYRLQFCWRKSNTR